MAGSRLYIGERGDGQRALEGECRRPGGGVQQSAGRGGGEGRVGQGLQRVQNK